MLSRLNRLPSISTLRPLLSIRPRSPFLPRPFRPFSSGSQEQGEGEGEHMQSVYISPEPIRAANIGVAFDLADRPGSLNEALNILAKHNLNLTSIANRASPLPPHRQMFYVHFEGKFEDEAVKAALEELKKHTISKLYKVSAPLVPWFPRKEDDLDQFSKSTLDAGSELECEHPGFTDKVYRERRRQIAEIAINYCHGEAIPTIDYTETEKDTWEAVWNKLTRLYPSLACHEFNSALADLQRAGIYGPRRIPQLEEVSQYIQGKTGFRLRPVTGLLSARDFLNALAFRVFFSTQYIRHHSVPMYTPEPDVCHELLGHAPMFLNPDFADFTQYIGLASLGASDEEIQRLATCYWFSVEFGLLFESGQVKAYGAGVLSSFGELQHATSPTNSAIEIRMWNPFDACKQEYPITKMQPVYFAASSLKEAKVLMKAYCDQIKKPFHSIFDPSTRSVYTDVDVLTRPVGLRFSPVSSVENSWSPL